MVFTSEPVQVKVPTVDGKTLEFTLHKVQFEPMKMDHECKSFNKGKCVDCGKKNPLVGKPITEEILVEAAKQLNDLYEQLPIHERLPNHVCTSCNGLGVGGPASDSSTNGKCWDCLGQGVLP